jgi:hypothetical protein
MLTLLDTSFVFKDALRQPNILGFEQSPIPVDLLYAWRPERLLETSEDIFQRFRKKGDRSTTIGNPSIEHVTAGSSGGVEIELLQGIAGRREVVPSIINVGNCVLSSA